MCRAVCAKLGWVYRAVVQTWCMVGVQDWAGYTGLVCRAFGQGWCAGLGVCRPAVRPVPLQGRSIPFRSIHTGFGAGRPETWHCWACYSPPSQI